MKVPWPYLLAASFAQAVVGQGMFTFNNSLPSQGIDAPFIYPYNYCGERYLPMEGSGWSFQLLAGPVGSQLESLEPITTLKADGPGYVVPITLTVPDVSAGSWAIVVVQIHYDNVLGSLGPYAMQLGDGILSLPGLPLGGSPIQIPIYVCPEPRSMLLIVFGVATLLWRRRACTKRGNRASVPKRAPLAPSSENLNR